MIQDISKAYKYKKTETVIFLGSGSSINDLSEEDWCKLKTFDLWTVNNWVYHPTIVPDFYHLELKAYGFPIVKERFEEKKLLYKNVKFIVPKDKYLTLRKGQKVMTLDAIPPSCNIYTYNWVNYKTTETDNIKADYMIKNNIVHRCYGTSLTSVLEIMYKFGYKRIILFGVDLSNSFYFWTGGGPKYGKVHHQTNKAHENKDPRLPHTTFRIKSFIVDFNEKIMLPKKREVFVGTKKSVLYPCLKFINVKDI